MYIIYNIINIIHVLLDHFPAIDTTTKKSLSTPSSTSVSTSSLTVTGSGGADKKAAGNHSIISSLKRFVSDVGNNNGIGNTTSATSECHEELDGVERGEGVPLSHLTASRAKAPRRRPPSSKHLRHHAAESSITRCPMRPVLRKPMLPVLSYDPSTLVLKK